MTDVLSLGPKTDIQARWVARSPSEIALVQEDGPLPVRLQDYFWLLLTAVICVMRLSCRFRLTRGPPLVLIDTQLLKHRLTQTDRRLGGTFAQDSEVLQRESGRFQAQGAENMNASLNGGKVMCRSSESNNVTPLGWCGEESTGKSHQHSKVLQESISMSDPSLKFYSALRWDGVSYSSVSLRKTWNSFRLRARYSVRRLGLHVTLSKVLKTSE